MSHERKDFPENPENTKSEEKLGKEG